MTQALRRIDVPSERTNSDHLNEREFSRIAGLVSQHTGIKLPPVKRTMVEGRLRKRARGLGLASLSDYCMLLFEQGGLEREFTHVVDAVTTNKTDFFREPQHFSLLERRIVPTLLDMRRPGEKPLLKLWSAASSNGAEAYTTAMVMADIAAAGRPFHFAILGTDISTRMLEAGRRAVYPAEMIEPVPAPMQDRYLMRGRGQGGASQVRMVPELRRRVSFQHLNLMDESYPIDRDVDVIFLRNVLIYFEKATQEAVVGRLMGHLRPGGFLMLGHSESMIGTSMRLRQIAPAVFQRT